MPLIAIDETYLKKLIKDAVFEAVEDMQSLSGSDAKEGDGLREEVPEPGARRKRRTKAEMEADKLKEVVNDLPVAQTVAGTVQKVEYKQVQEAVLKLVEADRKTDVMTVLSQFGVATAKALKPEQWAECYSLLQEKLAEDDGSLA